MTKQYFVVILSNFRETKIFEVKTETKKCLDYVTSLIDDSSPYACDKEIMNKIIDGRLEEVFGIYGYTYIEDGYITIYLASGI